MEPVEQLRGELKRAKERVRQLVGRWTTSSDVQEYRLAMDAQLDLERQVAARLNEPHAVPLDFPVQWDTGAPLPHLFANDYKTILPFYVAEHDPEWDGSYVTVKDPSDGAVESLALVEFVRCLAARFGDPNDEVLHGHPLHGRGQDPYTAQLVRNSPWIEELRSVNSIHDCFREEDWDSVNHYVLWFHDSTFEAIAQGYCVEQFKMSMRDLAGEAVRRLMGG